MLPKLGLNLCKVLHLYDVFKIYKVFLYVLSHSKVDLT